MRRPPLAKPQSYHNLIATDIRLLGRLPPTAARETKGRGAIDPQYLMTSPQLREAFIESFTPLPPGTHAHGMATMFTEAMLSTAANIAPHAKAMPGTEGVVF